VDERRIDVATGVTLSVLEAGAGAPRRLLLVHGFTGAKEDFADHLDLLAAGGSSGGWHVVAPDLRGHGTSSQPEGPDSYSFKTFAADLLALVDALGWDRFTLLGHSMGGMIAQVTALEAGGAARLDGLVLMDTSHGPIGGIDPEMLELGKAVVADGGMAALVEAQRSQEGALDTPANQRVTAERPGYAEFGERKSLAAAGDMWLGMIDEVVHAQADRLDDLVAGLEGVPVLVLVGEQDRPFVPHAERMAAAIPGARLVVITDAGHSPQFENPDEWYEALTAFLAEVGAS
jgi:2-succinyl-6-hydroxy-2,4-cyclohexadiene-1-carboxylate synthase